MPSGGHGSRGGGRSGGGSRGGSRGGFSRSSSHTSFGRSYGGIHHPHHHHRHIRIRIGRHYYGYGEGGSPVVAILLFFIIFVGMIAMGTGMSRSSIKSEMAFYEEQHHHYKAMIEYAKEHRDEGYIVDATVTARWHDEYTGKYSLDYEVRNGSIRVLTGYTYPCYTFAETTGLVGKTIEIALDSPTITYTTDSVDLAFENVTLEEDGDYMQAKESLASVNTVYAITLTITILLIVLLVWYSIKKLKLEDEEPKAVESSQTKTESSKMYCSYCGTACPSNATRCPSCGANLK